MRHPPPTHCLPFLAFYRPVRKQLAHFGEKCEVCLHAKCCPGTSQSVCMRTCTKWMHVHASCLGEGYCWCAVVIWEWNWDTVCITLTWRRLEQQPKELNIYVHNSVEMITIGVHAFIQWLLGLGLCHNVYPNEIQMPSIIICKCGGFGMNINIMHKTTCKPVNSSTNADTGRDLHWAVIQWTVPNYHLHQLHSGATAPHNASTIIITVFGKNTGADLNGRCSTVSQIQNKQTGMWSI